VEKRGTKASNWRTTLHCSSSDYDYWRGRGKGEGGRDLYQILLQLCTGGKKKKERGGRRAHRSWSCSQPILSAIVGRPVEEEKVGRRADHIYHPKSCLQRKGGKRKRERGKRRLRRALFEPFFIRREKEGRFAGGPGRLNGPPLFHPREGKREPPPVRGRKKGKGGKTLDCCLAHQEQFAHS